MKTATEVESHRQKTRREVEALERIIYGIKERTSIPEEAKRVGIEIYLTMLITKKVTLEIIVDTLDWVLEEGM
jgi:hypothetical protein